MTFLGIDIGTGSSKAVMVRADGSIVATASRPHRTSTPRPGWFEHDADDIWWSDVMYLLSELGKQSDLRDVEALGVSGIGPVALLADADNNPLRPAVLYGIDTRTGDQIATLRRDLGDEAILEHSGTRTSTQSVGPKLMWLAENDADTYGRARRWFNVASFIVARLTGEYVVDHYTASASDPLYDLGRGVWWEAGWEYAAPTLERPRLAWSDEIVGSVLPSMAEMTGLRAGTPVVAGSIDAAAEAYSGGSTQPGDMMVMYGSTLFCIQVVSESVRHPKLWAVGGMTADTYGIAAGMSTAGLVTTWFADIVGDDIGEFFLQAQKSPPGSKGLVLLPYFAGERSPLFDPQARGSWLGLTLDHSKADMARSILEGIAFGARHNIDEMTAAGARPRRLVAVGGGSRSPLWTQIVSDVTGIVQDVPSIVLGASYGDARLAADAFGVDTASWNPIDRHIVPSSEVREIYDDLYAVYRGMYPAVRSHMHTLHRLAQGN